MNMFKRMDRFRGAMGLCLFQSVNRWMNNWCGQSGLTNLNLRRLGCNLDCWWWWWWCVGCYGGVDFYVWFVIHGFRCLVVVERWWEGWMIPVSHCFRWVLERGFWRLMSEWCKPWASSCWVVVVVGGGGGSWRSWRRLCSFFLFGKIVMDCFLFLFPTKMCEGEMWKWYEGWSCRHNDKI